MKKLIIFGVLLTLSSQIFAASCYPSYKRKAKEIRDKNQATVQVGDQFYIQNDKINYYPGVTMPARFTNWAQDYLEAIEYGPELMGWSQETPKSDWLHSLYSSIKKDCRLNDNADMKIFRGMLHELMEDGSMCPGGEALKSSLIKPKAHFKSILKEAVASGRFADICSIQQISDDSYRVTKKVSSEKFVGPSPAGAKAGKQ